MDVPTVAVSVVTSLVGGGGLGAFLGYRAARYQADKQEANEAARIALDREKFEHQRELDRVASRADSASGKRAILYQAKELAGEYVAASERLIRLETRAAGDGDRISMRDVWAALDTAKPSSLIPTVQELNFYGYGDVVEGLGLSLDAFYAYAESVPRGDPHEQMKLRGELLECRTRAWEAIRTHLDELR
jgi:hypothetical protein